MRHQGVVDLVALDLGVERMLQRLVADLARAEIQRRLFGDQLAPLRGVLLAKQHVGGNLVELGIAVVGVAVGIGQLQRFHQGVNVVGRIEFQRLEVEAFQNVQRFDHAGPWLQKPGL